MNGVIVYTCLSSQATLMPKSEVGSTLCDSATRRRPRWARGGKCFAGFLDPPLHGKKTPVPPRGNLRGVITIGRTGANISSCGARRTPHLGIAPIVSEVLRVGTFGCQTVMVCAMGAVGDEMFSMFSIRTLKNVTLILLVGD